MRYSIYTDDGEVHSILSDLHMDGQCGGPKHCYICQGMINREPPDPPDERGWNND